MGKQCRSCGEVKELDCYHLDKNSKDGHVSLCKPCANARSNAWVKKNLADVVARKKERRKDVRKSLLESAQNRANIKGIPLSIRLEDIIVPTHCPILGIPIFKSTGKPTSNSPSLDRIVPELGYVVGNIQVISYKANAMKNDASFEDLIKFAEWVFKTIKVEHDN